MVVPSIQLINTKFEDLASFFAELSACPADEGDGNPPSPQAASGSRQRDSYKRPYEDRRRDSSSSGKRRRAQEPRLRPDPASGLWKNSEIRLLYADCSLTLDRPSWDLISSMVVSAQVNLLEYLLDNQTPLDYWKQFSIKRISYDEKLQCGVVEMYYPEGAPKFREILVQRLACDPPLQIILNSDDLVQTISTYPFKGYSQQGYVKFLVAMNKILQDNYFEFFYAETSERGNTYHFKTCDEVIEFIIDNDYSLPFICGRARFHKEIGRTLAVSTVTKAFQEEEPPGATIEIPEQDPAADDPPSQDKLDQAGRTPTPLEKPGPAPKLLDKSGKVLKASVQPGSSSLSDMGEPDEALPMKSQVCRVSLHPPYPVNRHVLTVSGRQGRREKRSGSGTDPSRLGSPSAVGDPIFPL
jgi:hypothetical protein